MADEIFKGDEGFDLPAANCAGCAALGTYPEMISQMGETKFCQLRAARSEVRTPGTDCNHRRTYIRDAETRLRKNAARTINTKTLRLEPPTTLLPS